MKWLVEEYLALFVVLTVGLLVMGVIVLAVLRMLL
jgi:hypothetical protein